MSEERSTILLCAEDAAAVADVHAILEQACHPVAFKLLDSAASSNGTAAGLIVVDGTRKPKEAISCCQQLRGHQGEHYTPILFMIADAGPATRLACLEAGADTYLLHPFEAAELLAQALALLRIKDRHDHLAEKTAEVQRINKRLHAAYQQIDQELELARRLQESFLPQKLPELPQARFAVHYRPCGHVGGDFYDIFRLDERHTGLYVADAVGHGVPASLLTIFVKRGVRAKEINGHDYRLTAPSEVLQHLNRDLIDQALSDQPFVTMVYGLFNHIEGTLQFSRAGHPYPLHIPRQGPAIGWQMEGSLLGVFDTQYKVRTEKLQPGDKLLLYSDGIDAAAFESQSVGLPSLIGAAERYRELPIHELVDTLASTLFQQTKQTDDLTILGLEWTG